MRDTERTRSPLFFAVSVCLLLCQAVVVRAQRLPITSYTLADGLAHERVKCVSHDSKGFIWFCTLNGLSRYDGYSIATYGTEDGLPHVSINDFLETSSGQYWVATNGGGVASFDPEGALLSEGPLFTAYSVGEGTPTGSAMDDLGGRAGPRPDRVNVLYEDRRGRLWAGTDDGLFRLDTPTDPLGFQPVDLDWPLQPGEFLHVWTLIEGPEGSLWVGTSIGLTRRFPDGRVAHFETTNGEGEPSVWTLLIEGERLWIGHGAGLTILYPEIAPMGNPDPRLPWRRLLTDKSKLPSTPGDALWVTREDGLVDEHVRTIYQTSDGRIWLGTNGGGWIGAGGGGLTEFDGSAFRSYTPSDGLTDDMILDLTEDRDGNLWVGTASRGAMKIATHGFTAYDETDGVSNTLVASIFEDRNGELYAVGNRAVINRFDGRRFSSIQPVLPEAPTVALNRWYYSAIQDRAGEWWVGTREGLHRFAKTDRVDQITGRHPKAIYTTQDGLVGNQILTLYEDLRGDIWFGTEDENVLTRWERSTATFHQYSERNGLPASERPHAYSEDRSGNLWIGFDRGGLARYRDGRFVEFTNITRSQKSRINQLYLDRAGGLWIVTAVSGVIRLDDPTADHANLVTNTPAWEQSACEARSVTEDQWGRIYIGTGCGVDRIDPATGRIKHYTTADGLGSNDVQTTFRDSRGTLWFGTRGGISRLVPAEDELVQPPPILIRGVRISGQPYPMSELGSAQIQDIELPPSQNEIEIDYVGLSFAVGRRLQYEYMLEGADADWNEPTDQNRIIYGNLSPGQYRFQVRALADGRRSPTPAVMAFTILPPIWQRGWFFALSALLLSSLGYAAYRYRLERLLQVERMRTRIAADLHDDIGAGLSRMVLLSEVLKREAAVDEQASRTLTKIGDTGRELVDSMADIVWSMNPRRDDLRSLVLRVRQFASDLLESKGIEWEFTPPEELENIKLSPDLRRHVLSIFKEALNNIVRHSECKSVLLHLQLSEGFLQADIQDDGCGFSGSTDDSTWRHAGAGLMNMQRRAVDLHGELKIQSSPGNGTQLKLRVPLD